MSSAIERKRSRAKDPKLRSVIFVYINTNGASALDAMSLIEEVLLNEEASIGITLATSFSDLRFVIVRAICSSLSNGIKQSILRIIKHELIKTKIVTNT